MRLSWGCRALDELTGGIEGGVVYLVHGFSQAGKTTLAVYQTVARILLERGELKPSEKFVVTDCDAGVSVKRLVQVCVGQGVPRELALKAAEDHLVYKTFFSFATQHGFWCRGGETEEGEKKRKPAVRELIDKEGVEPLLVVNDAATVIYRNLIMATPMKHRASTMQPYLARLGAQVISLLELAKEFDIPAFMVSYSASQVGAAFGLALDAPIGGRNLREIPKCILKIRFPMKRVKLEGREEAEVEDTEYRGPERFVVLQKSRDVPAGTVRKVLLTDKGFVDPQ